MRALIIAVLLLSIKSLYAYADFVYDDHGKRDPFNPLVTASGMVVVYDDNLSVNDLIVEGIMADKDGHNAAIINGRVIKKGDDLGPYKVDTIADDHVDLVEGSDHFVLKVKKANLVG